MEYDWKQWWKREESTFGFSGECNRGQRDGHQLVAKKGLRVGSGKKLGLRTSSLSGEKGSFVFDRSDSGNWRRGSLDRRKRGITSCDMMR